MRFTKLFASAVTLVFFASLPSFSQTSSTQGTHPSTAARPSYDRELLRPSLLKETAPDTYQVKFETTRGEFAVTVHRDWSPYGADRFYNLVKHHYYDGARFFRVLPNFVVQFGMSAYPPVTAAWDKATIKDDPVVHRNFRGTLTFAKTGMPNSRTTQIFINLKDNPSLDSQGFSAFAVVDGNGMNVVEMMYDQYGDNAGMDQDNIARGGEEYLAKKWPKLDIIKSATIVGGSASTTPAKPATTKPQ